MQVFQAGFALQKVHISADDDRVLLGTKFEDIQRTLIREPNSFALPDREISHAAVFTKSAPFSVDDLSGGEGPGLDSTKKVPISSGFAHETDLLAIRLVCHR